MPFFKRDICVGVLVVHTCRLVCRKLSNMFLPESNKTVEAELFYVGEFMGHEFDLTQTCAVLIGSEISAVTIGNSSRSVDSNKFPSCGVIRQALVYVDVIQI